MRIIAAGVLAVGFSAAVRGQEPPRAVAQEVMAVSGMVEEVDRAGRITIRYYDALIVEVTPGARMGPPKDTTAEAQQKVARPDAAVLQQTTLVVTLDSVDMTTGIVTYHGVDNRRVMRQVRHPSLIENLKAGDVVTVRQTRARAVSIEKQP